MSGGRQRIWIGLGAALVLALVLILLRAPVPVPAPQSPAGTMSAGGSPQGPGTRAAQPPAQAASPAIPPIRVDHTAVSTVDQEGRPQWDIRAATVSVDGTARTAELTGIEGVYYHEGLPSVTFAARRGTFHLATRDVTLSGGVRAQAASGRLLEAQTVQWSPRTGEIVASGDVVLRQEGMSVKADRLVADATLQRTRLSGNVRVTIAE
jgi:LPS export ABC transporter protein LptC